MSVRLDLLRTPTDTLHKHTYTQLRDHTHSDMNAPLLVNMHNWPPSHSITYSFKQFYRYLVCAGPGLDSGDIPSYPTGAVSTFRYPSAQALTLP